MPKKKSKPVKLSERQNGSGGASSSSQQPQQASPTKSKGKSSKKDGAKVHYKPPEGLSEFLDDSEFYLSVKLRETQLKGKNHLLGEVELKLADVFQEDVLDKADELWLYLSHIPGRSFLYSEWLETGDDGWQVKPAVMFRIDENTDLTFLAVESPSKQVQILLAPITDTSTVTLKMYLNDSLLQKWDYPSTVDRTYRSMQHLIKHFYGVEIPQIKFPKQTKESVEHLDLLYTSIKEYHQQNWDVNSMVDVQNSHLNVTLRPYQVNSVNWMLSRERLLHEPKPSELHSLHQELTSPDGEKFYYNKYQGTFIKEKPLVLPPTPGGILADEMGLGKTVEVLACVMANPRYKDNEERAEFDPLELPSLEAVEEEVKFVDGYDLANLSDYDKKVYKRTSTQPQTKVADEESEVMDTSITKDDVNISSNLKRSHSDEEEEESSESVGGPRKKVRFSNDLNVIPPEQWEESKEYDVDLPEKPSTKPSIKPYTNQNAAPLDEKEIRTLVHKQRRKQLEEEYQKKLQEYSAIKYIKRDPNRHAGLFEGEITMKSMFECVCGQAGDTDVDTDKKKVKCVDCGIVQHKKCVRFYPEKMGEYVCPHCNVRKPIIESKTTLIVAPSAISAQWMDEVHKLIKDKTLRVHCYEGVAVDGYHQPKTLVQYDVVITTYEVLTKELDYVDLPHSNAADGRRFRNAKRYTCLPSPLPCIQWWRICLDEAQMIEVTTTRSAEMALRLNSVHKWCITGTPVQHSLKDLYGLIMFLGVDPYCMDTWWDILVQGPFNIGNPGPLCEVVCPLMWRTAKVDVADQIDIPPQQEKLHWINFSPVEEHFYRRQHVDCSRVVLDRISQQPKLDTRLQALPKEALDKILKPLLHLRQACCHPQAVRGKFTNVAKDKTITMQQLLTNLIQKAKTECEESLRMIVSSQNGLAGLSMLQENWALAANYYREALALVKENKDKIKVDKLQKIHSLRNLNELLESHQETIPRNAEEIDLAKEAEELEANYMVKFTSGVENAKQALQPLSVKVDEVHMELTMEEAWWSAVVQWARQIGDKQEIKERVRQAIEGNTKKNQNNMKKKLLRYKNLVCIEAALLEDTESLEKLRNKLLKDMKALQTIDSQALVNQAVDCHLRTILTDENGKSQKKCQLCTVSASFRDYERILFREVTTKDNYEHLELEDVRIFGELQTIVWTAGDTERVLKTLLAYAKLKGAESEWLHDGATMLKELEAKKKEFKFIRALWSQINDYIAAMDELNMCKLRFRLRFENEPVVKNKPKKQAGSNLGSNLQNKVERINIIEVHEVEPQCLKLTLERSEGERSLRRRKGQLQYLLNLERDDIGSTGGENPEPCPICRKTLGTKWTVLLCGHCFCVECLAELKKRRPNKKNLSCPICREETAMGEISYVNTNIQQEEPTPVAQPEEKKFDDLVSVKGFKKLQKTHSAKAEVIVQEIRKILMKDPDDKILIFSAWTEMLDILRQAMTENDISCTTPKSGKKFQEAIQLFKDPLKKVTALLLPVSRGAKGLNLTEARHVFLVEPILNPATELQALGRIHRIGQTKKTEVHRFIVKGTIEERMHSVLMAHRGHSKVEEDPVTLRDLYNMFASQQEAGQSTDQDSEDVNDVIQE